jgi:hypothetical protein
VAYAVYVATYLLEFDQVTKLLLYLQCLKSTLQLNIFIQTYNN